MIGYRALAVLVSIVHAFHGVALIAWDPPTFIYLRGPVAVFGTGAGLALLLSGLLGLAALVADQRDAIVALILGALQVIVAGATAAGIVFSIIDQSGSTGNQQPWQMNAVIGAWPLVACSLYVVLFFRQYLFVLPREIRERHA